MVDRITGIEQQLLGRRDFDSPPLHLWHPPLSGDIDICIDADGQWFHEGRRFERQSILRLFASILRREEDGEYYLVTPGEKWRIRVEAHALVVTDFECAKDGLRLTLNTEREVLLTNAGKWYLDKALRGIAVVSLEHGLSAMFSRAAWYRLAEAGEVEGETLQICGLSLS